MNSLIIIRKVPDKFLMDFMYNNKDTAILAIQDGVLAKFDKNVVVYASEDDVNARGLDRGYIKINYRKMAELITENNKVIVW